MTDRIEFPQSRCRVGVSTGDITPPVGMYHRMWGAAAHDRSTGIHRPLRETTLVIAPEEADDIAERCAVFIALDHCLLGARELGEILDHLASSSGVDRERIVLFFSHTHAAGLLGRDRALLPGGDLILDYLAELSQTLAGSLLAALERAEPATILYGTGQCSLATNRDYFDEASGQSVCGFNPDGPADKTVVVARALALADERTLATIVNYACHPTTLAWDNTLISPDYIGAMRKIVEDATQAPCLFVQGASGDLGPREGFVGQTDVADRNGRQLGYAALSAIEALPPPGQHFQYAGLVVSGATLGTWTYAPMDETHRQATGLWQSHESTLALPYRADLPQEQSLREERRHWEQTESDAREAGNNPQARDARAMIERMDRRLARIEHLVPGPTYPYPLRLWRIGDAVWVALEGEHYHVLQRTLRERFPDVPLVIGTLANGSNVWYLPDEDSYGKGLYQEDASVLARGSLERLIAAIGTEVERLMDDR